MKKKFFSFLGILVVIMVMMIPSCYAATAYSVGSLWPSGTAHAGDDFRTNVANASNAYGWLSGYTSYYSYEPTYSYLSSSRLGSSNVFFINGHANSNLILTTGVNSSSYLTGISTGSNGATCTENGLTFTLAGLSGRSMSNTKLITFAGCNTGAGSSNLLTAAVNSGAKTAVGFSEEITSRFGDGPNWLKEYNYSLGNGYSVQTCITKATTAYPNTDLASYVTYRGTGSTVLGTQAKVSSLRTSSMTSIPQRILLPISSTYQVLELDNNVKCESIKDMTILNEIINNIKKYENEFNIDDYKITYNLVNAEEGFGYILLKYYIDGKIETNKVYMATINNNSLEDITIAGVQKENLDNTKEYSQNSLISLTNSFDLCKEEKINEKSTRNIFNTNNVLTKNYAIEATTLNENILDYNEKYYYDFNTKKLSYILTTYSTNDNITQDGYQVIIELN